MKERRKPVLGRVVPGVTPAAAAAPARLLCAGAGVQRSARRLAGVADVPQAAAPQGRTADAPIIALARRAPHALRQRPIHGVALGRTGGPDAWCCCTAGVQHAARFADFVAPLRAAGFAVIGIDAPAHGTSPGQFSDLPRFRDSLAEVLRAHEPIHAVIGHSLGGGAVLTVLAETADHHPKKICLFGVPSDMDYILESFAMMLGLEPARAGQSARALHREIRPARPAPCRWPRRRRACAFRCWWCTTRTTTSRRSRRVPRSRPRFRAPLWRTQGFGHSGALRDAATIQRVVEFLRAELSRLEADAEESFGSCGREVEQQRLGGIENLEIDAQGCIRGHRRSCRASGIARRRGSRPCPSEARRRPNCWPRAVKDQRFEMRIARLAAIVGKIARRRPFPD